MDNTGFSTMKHLGSMNVCHEKRLAKNGDTTDTINKKTDESGYYDHEPWGYTGYNQWKDLVDDGDANPL